MAGMNKAMLIGHLGKDPEVRYTPSGLAVASFSMATSEQWKDKDGEKQTRTEWHRIVAFGKLGEICGEYLEKGKQVYIEGRIQTRDWEDQGGVKRYITEIVANQMLMLGTMGQGGKGGQRRRPRQPGDEDYGPQSGLGGGYDPGDDIPF